VLKNEVSMALTSQQKIAIGVAIGAVIIIGIAGNRAGQSLSEKQSTAPAPQSTAASENAKLIQPTFRQGIAYTFNSTYQCTPAENKVCATPAEYETLCRQASGLTVMGAKGLTTFDHVGRALLDGGSVDNISVEWKDGLKECRAFLTVSGIYQGNSTRKSYSAEVYEFIVNDQNKVLGSGTTNPIGSY